MKRQRKNLQHIAALMLGVFLISSPAAKAEFNTGTGDVAGDTAALADSVAFELSSTGAGLTLVKTAFLTVGGTQLTTGATVPSGTLVDFMIYVDNKASVLIAETNIQDSLDPLFVYQADSIRVDNSHVNCAAATCTTVEEGTIYAAAAVTATLTDAVDGDIVSLSGPAPEVIDAGNGNVAGNGQLDAAASRVLAVVFTVQVQ